MVRLLDSNPNYCSWGPYEDYMCADRAFPKSWSNPSRAESWADFQAKWKLGDLNECVNFYFNIERVDDEPAARLQLILWWIHPRKGCSRGIEIDCIQQEDLPAIKKFLTEARDRNTQRFAGVEKIGS